jgi:hypothetical protein
MPSPLMGMQQSLYVKKMPIFIGYFSRKKLFKTAGDPQRDPDYCRQCATKIPSREDFSITTTRTNLAAPLNICSLQMATGW